MNENLNLSRCADYGRILDKDGGPVVNMPKDSANVTDHIYFKDERH